MLAHQGEVAYFVGIVETFSVQEALNAALDALHLCVQPGNHNHNQFLDVARGLTTADTEHRPVQTCCLDNQVCQVVGKEVEVPQPDAARAVTQKIFHYE